MLREVIPHQLVVLNIEHDRGLQEKIGPQLPVVEIGPYHLQPPFTRQDLQIMLGAAQDRISQMERVDQEAYQKRLDKGHTLSASDRLSNFFSFHYLAIANIFLFIYVGLPFLAPVLMKVGQSSAASIIYKIYSPLCHEWAFRSWFLFGKQPYYPRALAGIPNMITYETLTNSQQVDLLAAREYIGSEVVGYKVAFCQRDIAIYLFMLLYGLFFMATGRRIRAIPWYMWALVGLVPIGLDGFSQLPSLATGLPSWLLVRESTPFLRTLTGGLFGWMTAWYLFPMLEETAREARLIVKRKKAVIDQSGSGSQA
jgi:uncharacterized membrane protein